MTLLLTAVLAGVVAVLVLQIIMLSRGSSSVAEALVKRVDTIIQNQDRGEKLFREDLQRSRSESSENARLQRKEVQDTLLQISDSTQKCVRDLGTIQSEQFAQFSQRLDVVGKTTEERLDSIRVTLSASLDALRADNEKKLDQMRQTVDEKLQTTLDRRLGESFQQVSEKLEQVHKGLGEMQVLTAGVGDLKKVLSNVKARGTWGEVQLGNLLQEVFTEQQYSRNVETKFGSGERVEYAVKLPGNSDGDGPVWLPIDAKFPAEDYQRLAEAAEAGDAEAVEVAAKTLEAAAKLCAKTIRDKYICPPETTDFAIMFLPTEGLHSEVLRRPGLSEFLQREYRVSVTGPTTLCAFLNSLQMGFRTLAIAKRSSEVWSVLGAVKTEFGKFGDTLEAVRKKLDAASKSIETAEVRTRAIERHLKKVEQLPDIETAALLGDGAIALDAGLLSEEVDSPMESPSEIT